MPICIEIGFLFDVESQEERDQRLLMAITLLSNVQAVYKSASRTLKSGILEVVIVALVDKIGHHNFDSVLNKAWPDGCGAGWVVESHNCEDI